jgi:signal transduction histidine kinase
MQTTATAADGAPSSTWSLALALHVGITALLCLVLTLIWGVTGAGYFWPAWVWLGLGLPVAIHVVAHAGSRVAAGRRRGLFIHAGVTAALVVFLVCVWALAGGGYFWPIWPLAVLGLAVAVDALVVALWERLSPRAREQALTERVDVLTRTRRGALDVQAAELRRIERDLHDGAQARLVALSMQLGRAEERLAGQPEAAELVRRAREEAGAAIAELRDLARGIAPPVLADRGLVAAVEALGRRAPMPVEVAAQIDRRLLPVVETAAYFVVAESLTNAAKHAGGAGARVRLAIEGDRLRIEVADDGPGGADPAGSGLTGLRHRVEALDGTLHVISPPGGGTTIRAELPCGS